MAYSLVTPPAARPIFILSRKTTHLSSPRILKVRACSRATASDQVLEERHVQRRSLALGLVGIMLGLSVDERNASAAGRRPPPPPPTEKKDPNVSGVMAKIMASKKRKEAMKDSVEKLRSKGKTIQE